MEFDLVVIGTGTAAMVCVMRVAKAVERRLSTKSRSAAPARFAAAIPRKCWWPARKRRRETANDGSRGRG